jgi:hypothetical protein
MKEAELEHLFYDANEIESGVEVDDNNAFVCVCVCVCVCSGLPVPGVV